MMKTRTILIALYMLLSLPVIAQENSADWSRNRFFGINYDISSLKVDGSDESIKSKFGIAVNSGNTYLLHNKPLAGMIKFGLDVVWFDVNYVKYDTEGEAIIVGNEDYEKEFDWGTQKLDIGMGIGPSVNIAPFGDKGNALRSLRFGVYFHFTPSVSALIITDGDESKLHWGFSPVFNAGATIQWKRLGLGAEGRWSHAKFNRIGLDDWEEPSFASSSKTKVNVGSCRLFVRLCF